MSRIALVTGAASGIGLALSKALIDRGDTVIMTDADESALQLAVSNVSPGRGDGIGRTLDVRDRAAFKAVVDEVVRDFGRLDLLINNAGVVLSLGETDEVTLDQWNWVVDINLRGVIHGVDAVYPVMIGQRSGHIVNTASVAGLVPRPYEVPYVAAKHAVVGLSLSLRAEAAGLGIRVSALCPGTIDTPLLTKHRDKTRLSAAMEVPTTSQSRQWIYRMLPAPYSAERLAADALKGIDRNAALIVAPRSARVQWIAARLSPALNDRIGNALARQAQGILAEGS